MSDLKITLKNFDGKEDDYLNNRCFLHVSLAVRDVMRYLDDKTLHVGMPPGANRRVYVAIANSRGGDAMNKLRKVAEGNRCAMWGALKARYPVAVVSPIQQRQGIEEIGVAEEPAQ